MKEVEAKVLFAEDELDPVFTLKVAGQTLVCKIIYEV